MPEALYPLAVLACPVGMGLMMWMMMRGGGRRQPSADGQTAAHQAELARLQAQVDQLQAERHQQRTGTAGPPG